MQNTLIAEDWNNNKTEFMRGDRVLFHDDDGTTRQGVLGLCSDRSLHVHFDDGSIAWKEPESCELANFRS
jgi:hypothetical protein